MTVLVFNQLAILSKVEKAARVLKWSPGKNVLTGDNNVGKSTVVKSLYHALGADVPQMLNRRWAESRPIYCITFSLAEKTFSIVRDGRAFGVFDGDNQLIAQYQGIGSERGISQWWRATLGFRVELEDKQGEMKLVWPAYYFLPFYIDQDEGWTSIWSSFEALQAFKSYRKQMIDYHLGVRPQEYYDGIKKRHDADRSIAEIGRELDSLIGVKSRYVERKALAKTDIDPNSFKADIEDLIESLNATLQQQQTLMQKIKVARNARAELNLEVAVLRRSVQELTNDFDYAAKPETPEEISCPTCGAGYHNTIRERFHILDDIELCQIEMEDRQKEAAKQSGELEKLEAEYAVLAKRFSNTEEILQREKKETRFEDVIRSEGYKDIVASINTDIDDKQEQIDRLQARRDELALELKRFGPAKNIHQYYASKMKQYLNELNVQALTEDDYANAHKTIKNDVLGSDLPRALLAQVFALLHTMLEFGRFTRCPMVVDSPFQQEQDDENALAIWSFILSKSLPNQQLIVASVEDELSRLAPEATTNVNVVRLVGEYSLLQKDQYKVVGDWLLPMHAATLKVK